MDPSRLGNALEPGRVTFDEKMEIRRAIENANIPHTYVSANCFAAYFSPNLCQLKTLLPPKERVGVYGDGNVKGKKVNYLSINCCFIALIFRRWFVFFSWKVRFVLFLLFLES